MGDGRRRGHVAVVGDDGGGLACLRRHLGARSRAAGSCPGWMRIRSAGLHSRSAGMRNLAGAGGLGG